jgi:16S rRNA pseudouridine516 synthase
MSAVRLDRLLANLGYGSRREVTSMVRAGLVTLDGAKLNSADARIAVQDQPRLKVADEAIDPLPGLVLMLNKPVGTTCSHKELGPLVYDLLPERWRRREPPLSCVGRLDKATSGLLLVTDDGALLHRIISPKAQVPKRYRATLAQPLRGDEGAVFGKGTLMLDGEAKPLLPARMEVLGPTEVVVTIEEGRYHQVRRMFAAVGNHVETLHREALGGLPLPADLPYGAYRVVDGVDVSRIFDQSSGDPASSRK